MQFLILLLMLLALFGGYFLLRNRKIKTRMAYGLAVEFVLLTLVVWYFLPTSVPVAVWDNASMSIAFEDDVLYPNEAQSAEVLKLVGQLRVRRPFFNGYNVVGGTVLGVSYAGEYIYVNLYGENGSLGLHLDSGDPGNCYTSKGGHILNPEALCAYLKELKE